MSLLEPRVRAPVTKAILELIDEQPRLVRGAIREAAAEAVAHTEAASRVDWIALRVQLRILRAVHTQLGPRGFDDFAAAHFARTVEQPLAKSVFETTVRLFGGGPGPVLKIFPKSWAMMSSNCGTILCDEPDPAGTLIRIVELPVSEENIDLFVSGFRPTFRGVFDALKCAGDVEMLSFDRARREARYRAHWR